MHSRRFFPRLKHLMLIPASVLLLGRGVTALCVEKDIELPEHANFEKAPLNQDADQMQDAARLCADARKLWDQKDFRRALPIAEAAHALSPQRAAIGATLSAMLAGCAVDLVDPGGHRGSGSLNSKATDEEFEKAVELAQRGLKLLRSAASGAGTTKLSEQNESMPIRYMADFYLKQFMEKILILCQQPDGRTYKGNEDPAEPKSLRNLLHYGSIEEFSKALHFSPAPWLSVDVRRKLADLAIEYRTYKKWPEAKPAPQPDDDRTSEERVMSYLHIGREMTPQDVEGILRKTSGGGDKPNEWLKFIDEAMEVLNAPTCALNREQRIRVRAEFEFERYLLLRLQPHLGLETSAPWTRIEKLLDVHDSQGGVIRFFTPLMSEGAVYVMGVGHGTDSDPEGPYLQLIRYWLANGYAESLAKMPVDTAAPWWANKDMPQLGHMFQERKSFPAELYDGNYYVSPDALGVFAFPTDGGPAERIIAPEILPTESIKSLVAMEGKLYLATNTPGYLLSYDLKTRQYDVLASSLRKEKLSLLDDGPPFSIPYMFADHDRHRLVLYVQSLGASGLGNALPTGIYEFNIQTGKFHHLGFSPKWAPWMSRLDSDHVLIDSNNSGVIFDLRTNKMEPFPKINCSRFLAPLLPLDGWLWTASPWARYSIDGKRREFLPPLRYPDKKSDYFYPQECLELIGDSREVLVSDQFTLWRLYLPPTETTPK